MRMSEFSKVIEGHGQPVPYGNWAAYYTFLGKVTEMTYNPMATGQKELYRVFYFFRRAIGDK
jgi:hypothetical protein